MQSTLFWKFKRDLLIPIVDRLGCFLPDVLCLKLQFRCRMGYSLNLNKPSSFSEKIQWLKIYDRNPLYTILVDKYKVKEFVKERIGSSYIIPTIGVWESCDEIEWEKLPKGFVLKTTHDGGSAGVYICKDKQNVDKNKVNAQLSKSLTHNIYRVFREWPYKNVRPRIIAEKFMDQGNGDPLTDYKFFCFNGVPKFLYVRSNGARKLLNFVSMDWEAEPFKRADSIPSETLPEKPSQFETMKNIAASLSKDFPFVRVDLYEINNRVYFSELTFYPSSGLLPFVPQEWDFKLGDLLILPSKKGTK